MTIEYGHQDDGPYSGPQPADFWEELIAYRRAIQTAIDHWPGEAHLGIAYYALKDVLGRFERSIGGGA